MFDRFTVDPKKIAVAGSSDGGCYALTLGLINGDLFGDILAFSPGFTTTREFVGQPRVYISHGTRDTILPFARTGQPLARQLEEARYDVRFDAFEGGRTDPPDKVRAATDWWLTP